MTEKFVLVNLKGKRAKKLAEVISNDTCRRILDYLSEKEEASASEISKNLNIPMSTINYNVKSLMQNKLIESKEFKWSPKGREMNLFKLARKFIIISPGKFEGLGEKLKTILPIVFVLAIIGFAYMFSGTDQVEIKDESLIKKFNSVGEIQEFLDSVMVERNSINYFGRREPGALVVTGGTASSAAGTTQAGASSISYEATDYSATNIQVKGVDEADFVKNDDKYIYMIKENKLLIIDAYPAESAEIVSEIDLSDSIVRSLFINEDRLIVFVENWDTEHIFEGHKPIRRSVIRTHALIYDISDRKNPSFVKDYNLNGYYFEARMVDDYIYLVIKEGVYYDEKSVDIPILRRIKESEVFTMWGDMDIGHIFETQSLNLEDNKMPEIYYDGSPGDYYIFNTVITFDVFGNDLNAQTFMMGDSSNLYMSKDNIYLTYRKDIPYNQEEIAFYEIILPKLPRSIRKKVGEIRENKGLNYDEREIRLSNILKDWLNMLDINERKEFMTNSEEELKEYEKQLEKERDKTVIHKIHIDRDKIEYKKSGEVPGQVLNQFSMDEYDNHFRIATTIRNRQSSNNIYVLDKNLKIVGELENLAPGEKIYSARFMGEKSYLVTFRQIDPLFVIDLSDHKNPKVLGKLKIPGYSDYLHPYDENYIIGIGKDTVETKWGGALFQGVKMALFDVSDVENPKEIDKVIIGKRGSDSEVLRDHKAFLFDREKNILVLPVDEVKEIEYYHNQELFLARDEIWKGTYVFRVSPEEGFELRGTITHSEMEEGRYAYTTPETIRRSLYMDDVLYTISGIAIKMNNINIIPDEINMVYL